MLIIKVRNNNLRMKWQKSPCIFLIIKKYFVIAMLFIDWSPSFFLLGMFSLFWLL